MKTKSFKTLSLLLVIAVITSALSVFGIQASAATTYSAMSTKQITVNTGNAWSTPSLTFKCNADYYTGNSYAPKLSLKIYNHNTGKTTWARVTGTGRSISSTLRLEKNKRYTVTVSYLYDANVNKNALQAGGGKGWTQGKWYISSTSNLNSYSVR